MNDLVEGCLKDEKFGEKMKDSMLYKNLDHKYLTLEDIIKENASGQEEKEGEADAAQAADAGEAADAQSEEEKKEEEKTSIYYVTDDNFEVGRSSYNNLNSIGNQLDERIELQTAEASSSMGKSVNEMVENDVEEENNKEEGTKIAVNTSATENKKVQEEEQNTTLKNEETKTSTNTTTSEAEVETTKVEEKVENPTFEKPVEGTVVKEFAKDNLVYSNTLKEWTTPFSPRPVRSHNRPGTA